MQRKKDQNSSRHFGILRTWILISSIFIFHKYLPTNEIQQKNPALGTPSKPSPRLAGCQGTVKKRVKVPSSKGSRAKARMVRKDAGRTKLLQPLRISRMCLAYIFCTGLERKMFFKKKRCLHFSRVFVGRFTLGGRKWTYVEFYWIATNLSFSVWRIILLSRKTTRPKDLPTTGSHEKKSTTSPPNRSRRGRIPYLGGGVPLDIYIYIIVYTVPASPKVQ